MHNKIMKTVKIASKTSGVSIRSVRPRFKYTFKKADVPLEIKGSHSEKILKNSNFYLSDKPIEKPEKVAQKPLKQEKSWLQELEDIKGIGKKSAEDIIIVYPNKGDLLKILSEKKKLPFPDNIEKLLKDNFIQ